MPEYFRRSVLATTLLLRDFVKDILARSTGKIILVGHSMGAVLTCLLPYYLPGFAERIERARAGRYIAAFSLTLLPALGYFAAPVD